MVYHPEPPHAQSLFLFPIVFGINGFLSRWFSFLFLSFSCPFCVARYARVVATQLSCLERTVRKKRAGGSSLLIAHWSFRCPCHVNWPLYVTIKERKMKYKTNSFPEFPAERRRCLSWSVTSRSCYGRSFLLFFSFLFNDGTTGVG